MILSWGGLNLTACVYWTLISRRFIVPSKWVYFIVISVNKTLGLGLSALHNNVHVTKASNLWHGFVLVMVFELKRPCPRKKFQFFIFSKPLVTSVKQSLIPHYIVLYNDDRIMIFTFNEVFFYNQYTLWIFFFISL